MKRRMIRALIAALILLVGFPGLYVAAGIAGSLIPANADWREPREGVRIFVRTNGVHTWLLLPKVAEGIDWRPLANPADIRDRRYAAGDYLAFGFGNRDFYLNTPSWADLSARTAIAAAFGRGSALVHVEHVYRPQPDAYQSAIMLTPSQYRRLAAFVRASFRFDPQGRPLPLRGRGYGPADTFYEAQGAYDAGRTCNEWTGEGLRDAGVRVGTWTPFSQSIMWRFEADKAGP